MSSYHILSQTFPESLADVNILDNKIYCLYFREPLTVYPVFGPTGTDAVSLAIYLCLLSIFVFMLLVMSVTVVATEINQHDTMETEIKVMGVSDTAAIKSYSGRINVV